MDPLAILKDFCLGGTLEQVVIEPERVRFADKYSFPKATPTAFKSRNGSGDLYSLEAVAFFIKAILSKDANMGKYVAAAVRTRTPQIDFRDREALRDYLCGKIDHTVHIADVVPTVAFEPAAKKQRTQEPEAGAATMQHLMQQERQLRDRNSLLCAPGADFKPVLQLVDRVLAARKAMDTAAAANAKAAAAAGAKAAKQQQAQRPSQPQQKQPAFMKPSGRMERGDTLAGLLEQGASAASVAATVGRGYGIQPQQQAQAAAAPEPAAAKHQQQPQHKAPAPAPAPAPAGGGKHGSGAGKCGSSSSSRGDARQGSSKHKGHSGGGVPIILVPSGITALMNIFNARQFLEEGRFVRSDEAMASSPARPTKPLEFTRTALRSGPDYPRYQVTDKVPRPGHPDWRRVVAVVVQGKAWQFKEFPFSGAAKGELMETFSQVLGAYFHYADEKVPDNVAAWKVVKLPLRRTARHLDHTAMMDFYAQLDAFLAAKRCELEY